jgi:hypothetical protein
MKFDLNITKLPLKNLKEDKDYYQLKFETYNGKVEGKFEKSDIRHIIQILDNEII